MKTALRKPIGLFLLLVLLSSPACQLFVPSQPGTVVSSCAEIVSGMSELQTGEIPQHLLDTGMKQGGELDVNEYFNALTHLSMREGYTLDYVYQNDDLGGYPMLYARAVEEDPQQAALREFRDYLEVEDTEAGYFEYVVMDIMASQFYLSWHANYNDTQIVCSAEDVNAIVAQVSSGDFGAAMDLPQQLKARTLRNIEPTVRFAGDIAIVELVTFTKWGGFYRETYTISRETPHKIIDIRQKNLVPYDCGVMF